VEQFSVFNPRNLFKVGEAQASPTCEYLKTMYGFSPETLKDEFTSLFNQIKVSEFYKKYSRDPPEVFWPDELSVNKFPLTATTKQVFKLALVQTVTTVQVKSLFSRVSYTINEWRTRMTTPMLEAVLRLKVNGPSIDHLNEFPKDDLAFLW